jgi:preprotein translocase subunit YajC
VNLTGFVLNEPYLAAEGSGSPVGTIVLFAIIALGMYLLFLRPQRSRMRRAQEMQRELLPGAQVMTSGGLFGTVAAVEDDAVLLEVAPGVTTRWARAAIGRVVSPEESLGLGESSGSGGIHDDDADPTDGRDDPVR